jgi:hypothetical protein
MTNAVLADRPPKPLTRTRDADAAWAQHRGDPTDDRISEEARRAVRNFKRSLVSSAEAIDGVANDRGIWRVVSEDFFFKKGVGRGRAFEKICRIFAPATVEVWPLGWLGTTLLVRWLSPGGSVLDTTDPSFGQNAVVVRALSLAVLNKRVMETTLFPCEVPDHTLHRMFQRSPGIDAARAINQAADAFMAMDMRMVDDLRRRHITLVLPAGDGVFLANPVFGRVKRVSWRIFARPRTFIGAAMIGGDQRPLPPAEDVGFSTLACSWTLLTRKFPLAPTPVKVEELDQLIEGASSDE